jgi:hypothetical protein
MQFYQNDYIILILLLRDLLSLTVFQVTLRTVLSRTGVGKTWYWASNPLASLR